MFRTLIVAFVCCLGLVPTAEAQTAAADFTVEIDGDFTESDIQFTGELGIVYRFMWDARVVDGQIAVCGTGVFVSSRVRNTVIGMLRGGHIDYGGVQVLEDLTYFNRANTLNAMRSGQANCRYASDSTRRNGPLSLVFGDGVFRN